jgi:hypothetical protein
MANLIHGDRAERVHARGSVEGENSDGIIDQVADLAIGTVVHAASHALAAVLFTTAPVPCP